ncbi:MAG: C4-type zinc ribbon domain-containing protein [bacterium]
MREQLAKLRELQQIDLQLDEYGSKKKEILERLNLNKGFLQKLVDDLESQKAELDEIRGLQTQKQDDLKEIQEQHNKRKKRLTAVGSTKEFSAVEREIEVLKKSVEQTEEELLHLAEVIETTQESISEKEDKINQLRESISADEAEAEGQLSHLAQEIQALNDREAEARTVVSKRVLYKYDFIRSRRPGLAIVAARDAHCEGCYMAVPAQLYIEVQRGETLQTCPSCQRILYFGQEEENAVAAEA